MSNKKQSNTKPFLDPKNKFIIYGIIGVLALLSIIFIIVESFNGTIKISNNTDLDLEYIQVYFEGTEQDPIGKTWSVEDLSSGQVYTDIVERTNLLGMEAVLEIRFKFAEYEDTFLIDAGYFNDNFDGKINIDFIQVDDELVQVEVKASNGLLPTSLIDCNEIHDVYYKEGYVAE